MKSCCTNEIFNVKAQLLPYLDIKLWLGLEIHFSIHTLLQTKLSNLLFTPDYPVQDMTGVTDREWRTGRGWDRGQTLQVVGGTDRQKQEHTEAVRWCRFIFNTCTQGTNTGQGTNTIMMLM